MRATEPSPALELFATPHANRRALVAQVVFGLYLIGMFTWVATRSYYAAGGPGEPRSPLYGIWNVEELSVDGEKRPAVVFINADAQATHQAVVHVMEAARAAGYVHITFATQSSPTAPRK